MNQQEEKIAQVEQLIMEAELRIAQLTKTIEQLSWKGYDTSKAGEQLKTLDYFLTSMYRRRKRILDKLY